MTSNKEGDTDMSRNRAPVRISLSSLMEGQREVIIIHDGDEYRLRLTSNEKLILTK